MPPKLYRQSKYVGRRVGHDEEAMQELPPTIRAQVPAWGGWVGRSQPLLQLAGQPIAEATDAIRTGVAGKLALLIGRLRHCPLATPSPPPGPRWRCCRAAACWPAWHSLPSTQR